MAKKDKRLRGCPNPDCPKYEEKAKVKDGDAFCSVCGSELVLVCAKCHGPLKDKGPEHRVCLDCEAKAADRKAKVVEGVKKVGGAAAGAAAGAAMFVLKRK